MSYSSASDVEGYCAELIGSACSFSDITNPSKSEVERLIVKADAFIDAKLQSMGFAVPIDSGNTVFPFLVDLSALYAAARAQLGRGTARVTPQQRTKSETLMAQFNNGMKELLAMDLSRMGVTQSTVTWAGGITESGKTAVESDTDRVPPRFKRDQFRHSGTQRPSAAGGEAEED